MRASSANQISIVLQSMPFSRATVSRRVGKLMEWPAPPSRRDILAGDSNRGADDEDCSAWHRPRQECVQCCWSGPIRCCGPTSAGPEGYADRPGRKTAELHCRHEACLRRPSSWSPVRSSGARHSADVIGVCPSLCQGTEERRSWRRRNRRSGDAPNYAFRRDEDRRRTRYEDTPPIERAAARMAGLGSASVDDRRQATTHGDQQARKQVPAQAADPWSTSGTALCCGKGHRTWPMGEESAQPCPPECCGRSVCQ